ERVVGGLHAGRQDRRIEIDVATRAVPLGLDLLHRQRANLEGAAVFRPGFAWVGGGGGPLGDGPPHGPALWAAADPPGDLLFEKVWATLREIILRDRDGLRRRQQ